MRARWLWRLVVALGWSTALVLSADAAKVQRVSVNTAGEQANTSREFPYNLIVRTSPDGRYAVFESNATNLWPVDGNSSTLDERDVFLRDRALGITELISQSSSGEPGNAGSVNPFVTADGRYVFFHSSATNLVTPATPLWQPNVYLRDRLLDTTELVTLTSTGAPPDTNHTGVTDITPDGRYLLFVSDASNIVPGDTNRADDVFVRDRLAGTTERVSLSPSGAQLEGGCWPHAISADGRDIIYSYGYWYLYDRLLRTTARVDIGGNPGAGDPSSAGDISPTGRFIAFFSGTSNLVPGDTNDFWDFFLRDRELGTTERVSVSSTGGQGQPDGDTGYPDHAVVVSADGRYVAFSIDSRYLVPEDSNDRLDVFLRDRVAGTTILVNATPSGGISSGAGLMGSMSDDGACIAFSGTYDAGDLVPGDTNNAEDAFVWDRDARFFDVPSCYWAFAAIEACVTAEIVAGYPDLTYRPVQPVTRDQMAVYIARALAGGDANVPAFTAPPNFPDVGTDQWALKYVEYAVAHGVVEGYPDGYYHPEDTVDRGQMAAFIARAMVNGEANVPNGPTTAFFPDVPTDYWAFKYVEYIRGESVTGGYTDGNYHPEYPCTRDQMAVFMQRAFHLPI